MPGLIAHQWAATRILDITEVASNDCVGAFLFGSLAPDLGYWPGIEHFWSDLAHYIGSVTLVRRMLELSDTAAWQAFSLGWLLHIYLDIYGHSVINRIAAERYGDKTSFKSTVTYEENPIAHTRIEIGLDLANFADPCRLEHSFGTLRFPAEITPDCPLIRAFRDCYGQTPHLEALSQMICRVPGMYASFIRWQARLNGWNRPPTLAGRMGHAAGWILAQLLKISPRKGRGSYIAAMIQPDRPTKTEFVAYRDAIQAGMQTWRNIASGAEPWPEDDFNLDSGCPARRGEYSLADKVMDYLVEANLPERIRNRFGEDADNTLCCWEKIRAHFEGSTPI